jgi:hypothetical protein
MSNASITMHTIPHQLVFVKALFMTDYPFQRRAMTLSDLGSTPSDLSQAAHLDMNMKLPTAATSRAAAPTIVHSTVNSMSGLRSLRLNTRISPVILRQCNPASLTCRERGVIHCNRPLIDYYKSARIVHPVRPQLGKCTMPLHPPVNKFHSRDRTLQRQHCSKSSLAFCLTLRGSWVEQFTCL